MTRAQTDCEFGRLVAMVPVEAHLHPCEIVGVDLLAVGAQHDGGVDAFHARARRSQWLTPGDFGREAGEAAGILRGGTLVDPAVVTGVVGRAAHDVSIVVCTGRLALQLELAAWNQLAELRCAVEQGGNGLRRLHLALGTVGHGPIIEGQRGPTECVTRRRAAGGERGRLLVLQQRIGFCRIVVLELHLATHGRSGVVEVQQRIAVLTAGAEVQVGSVNALECLILDSRSPACAWWRCVRRSRTSLPLPSGDWQSSDPFH